MNYLGEDELTGVMGLGYPGEVRAGPDGNLYQWVEGYDGLGNPIGFWRAIRRAARSALPFIMPAVAAHKLALSALRRPRRRRRRPVMQPVAPAQAATAGWGLGEDEMTQVMGLGYPGEVRAGPDGNLYQWVEGYDGLGNPFGFWKRLRRGLRRLARRALPLVQRFAPAIPIFGPAVAAGLTTATPFLKQAGILGYDGLGALYQAPDGTLYQVQGFAEDEELRGFAEDEELRGWGVAEDEELRGLGALYQAPDGTLYQVQGLAEDDELRGFAEDEELRGFAEDEELRGFAEDEELRGFAEDEELRGFAEDEELRGFAEDDELRGLAEDEELRGLYGYDGYEGYVREEGVSGMDAYVPEQAAQTRWFTPPAQPPDMWRPLW